LHRAHTGRVTARGLAVIVLSLHDGYFVDSRA
jgi:hypothetical protein